MVHNLDRHNQDVGKRVEAAQVFGGVITRIIKAWGVEKSQQRSFRSGKLVLSRKARARLEAFANLGRVGAGQKFDDRRFAALGFPKEPNHRHRRPLTQLLPGLMKSLVWRVCIQKILDRFEHSENLAFPEFSLRPYSNSTVGSCYP